MYAIRSYYEEADGVRAAADAGDEGVGEAPAVAAQVLLARLAANDALEVAHHGRVRMRLNGDSPSRLRITFSRASVTLKGRPTGRQPWDTMTSTSSGPSNPILSTVHSYNFV